MTEFIPFSRDQAFLLPSDAKDWLPADDVAQVVVAAVDRVPLGAFAVRPIPGGKAQYHPRLLLALLIYADANGIFSSRGIERATHRDIGVPGWRNRPAPRPRPPGQGTRPGRPPTTQGRVAGAAARPSRPRTTRRRPASPTSPTPTAR